MSYKRRAEDNHTLPDKVLAYLKSKHFMALLLLLGGGTGTIGWQHWANLAENTAYLRERFESKELPMKVDAMRESTEAMRDALLGVQAKQDIVLERLEELRKQPHFRLETEPVEGPSNTLEWTPTMEKQMRDLHTQEGP